MMAWLRTRRRSAGDAEEHAAARIAALPRDDPSAALQQVCAWLGEPGSVRGAQLAGSLSALELLDHAARSHYRDLVEADRLPPAAFGATLDKGGVMQTLRQLARHWLRADAAREPLAA